MSDTIQSSLQQYFGFDTFRPGQKEVVAHLLDGHSAAAVFPTGGGKSLCYQLPAILLSGVTLVRVSTINDGHTFTLIDGQKRSDKPGLWSDK